MGGVFQFKSSSDSADVNRIAKTFERRVSALDRGKLNRSLFGKDRGVDSDTNLVVLGFINSMLVDILKGRSVSEDSLESRFKEISLGSSHRDVYKEAGVKKYCGYCGSKIASLNGIEDQLKLLEKGVDKFMKNPDEVKRKELLEDVRDLLGSTKVRYTGNEVHGQLKDLEKNLENAKTLRK